MSLAISVSFVPSYVLKVLYDMEAPFSLEEIKRIAGKNKRLFCRGDKETEEAVREALDSLIKKGLVRRTCGDKFCLSPKGEELREKMLKSPPADLLGTLAIGNRGSGLSKQPS